MNLVMSLVKKNDEADVARRGSGKYGNTFTSRDTILIDARDADRDDTCSIEPIRDKRTSSQTLQKWISVCTIDIFAYIS